MPGPWKAWMEVRKDEWPLAISMFSYFFLVIGTFWILKPLKKAFFIEFYDATGVDFLPIHRTAAQAEQIAKIGNMVIAFLAVIVFTWLARRYRRERLTYVLCAFFALVLLVYIFIAAGTTEGAGDLTVWTFYWFGDLYSTLMVTAFFAFLNDSVTPEAAKRLYGPIGLGGVIGGVVGATFVGVWIKHLPPQAWLAICIGLTAGIVAVATMAGRYVAKHPPPELEEADRQGTKNEGNPAWEGARLVFRSRYLLAIVGIVAIFEVVSSLSDFIFTSTVSHYLSGPEIGVHFSRVFAVTNWASLAVQLFLTGFVMTRFGVGTALLVLPCSMALANLGFAALPVLWAGSLLNPADGSFSYSINQSAKEAMYVPTTRDEKYKAKAFIDMFVQRFGKSLAVVLSLVVTTVFTDFETLRWLSLVTAALAVSWILVARYAGRQFELRTSGAGS